MRLFSRWDRTIGAARLAVGLMITTFALCSMLAPAAGAKVIYDPVIHKKFGIFPSFHGLTMANRPLGARTQSSGTSPIGFSGTPTCDTSVDADCTSLMTNTAGGPVQHGEQDFLFFWAPSGYSFPAAYVSGMQTFLSGLQAADYGPGVTSATAGNPLSVTQQYYDNSGPGGSKSFIPLAIQNAGSIMATDPYPNNGQDCTDSETGYSPTTCVTGDDIQNEVTNYIANHTQPGGAPYPTGVNVEYFVLTPPGVGTCDDGTSQACTGTAYCAWHTFGTMGGNPTTFANMPYIQGVPGCDVGVALNNDGTDSIASTFSHELAETMTDPLLNAWQGSGGGSDEIGDKCGYQYVVGNQSLDPTGLPTQNGSGTPSWYNLTLGGHNYLLQMEFDNLANGGTGGCNQWDTDTQPSATVSGPGSVPVGTATTFSLQNVSAPSGIAYVNWNFGDNSAPGTTTGTAGIPHTFQNPGNYTVTAIIADNHGNEVVKTVGVQVTSGTISPPVYTTGLRMAGTFHVGQVITAIPGSWTNNPTSFNYQWYLCNSGGTGCAPIQNANGSSYKLIPATVGHKIKLGVEGVNAAGPGALVATGASPLVTGAPKASLALLVQPRFPAPRGAYAVHLVGRALAGGILGSGHNRSEVTLYEQGGGTCALTWAGEAARARSGSAVGIGSAFVAAGPFNLVTHRTATSTKHATVRFCGYVARSAVRTDAHATAFYTTT